MSPLSTYSGLTRPPRAISAPQDVTPEAVMPEAVSLPGAIRPDIGLGPGGDGSQRGLPSGITQEDIDNLDPITMKDVRANAGRLAAYGIPLAMSAGNPMSLVLPGAADLLATGVKKIGNYLGPKIKGMMGLGGTQEDAPPSGLPAHGPPEALEGPSYDTKGSGLYGDGEGSSFGETHGPSQGMDQSESFNTNDYGWGGENSDDGWF